MGEPITRQDDSKRELRRTNTEYVLMALAGFILGWTVHHLVGTYFSSWLSASLVFAIAWALLIVFGSSWTESLDAGPAMRARETPQMLARPEAHAGTGSAAFLTVACPATGSPAGAGLCNCPALVPTSPEQRP
jgi:hypothetical protein